jgi:hypothetical protein
MPHRRHPAHRPLVSLGQQLRNIADDETPFEFLVIGVPAAIGVSEVEPGLERVRTELYASLLCEAHTAGYRYQPTKHASGPLPTALPRIFAYEF